MSVRPGFGFAAAAVVERRFQPRKQGSTILAEGCGMLGGRHGARAKLAHDLLPDLGALARAGDVDLVQPQARSLEPFVVAGDAVAIEHPTVARRG